MIVDVWMCGCVNGLPRHRNVSFYLCDEKLKGNFMLFTSAECSFDGLISGRLRAPSGPSIK